LPFLWRRGGAGVGQTRIARLRDTAFRGAVSRRLLLALDLSGPDTAGDFVGILVVHIADQHVVTIVLVTHHDLTAARVEAKRGIPRPRLRAEPYFSRSTGAGLHRSDLHAADDHVVALARLQVLRGDFEFSLRRAHREPRLSTRVGCGG